MKADVDLYGWEAFEVIVVQQDASKLERRTISSFMATIPARGYNILKGAPMRWKFQGRKKK
eukprot:1137002-Pelagomonas_calceolata.AAC.5